MDWQEQNRVYAFNIIKEENAKLNCFSPIRNKEDMIKRLEDIAMSLQDLSLQDQRTNNQKWSSYQYDVLDIIDSIQYIKENLPDEV